MTHWDVLWNLLVAVVLLRQVFVLAAIIRSGQFLRSCPRTFDRLSDESTAPLFFIVIPVLREAPVLRETVSHFAEMSKSHGATIVVVTTERELDEAAGHCDAGNTVAVAEVLARGSDVVHLHYPEPGGLKADQLNLAASYCLASVAQDAQANAFLVIYDADSRPPLDSLSVFENAISQSPGASVFHQSSRFELRSAKREMNQSIFDLTKRAIADSGALRANRFVLGYEVPRLINRSNLSSRWKQKICTCIYAHITGHGLCVRLPLLEKLPFPSKSPMEDMHYSFLLDSWGLPIVPIPSLDCAEVSSSLIVQFQQLSRWIFGPARFARYLRDPATQPGWRAYFLALSAAGITMGWVSCAFFPFILSFLYWQSPPVRCLALGLIAGLYAIQLILVDQLLGAPSSTGARIVRLVAYPFTLLLFGFAGLMGVVRLICGRSGVGKTERTSNA